MQHTLLPPHERTQLRREYRIRAVIIFCFLLSLAGLVGAATLFPSFIFALNEERSQIALLESLKKDKDENGVTALELDFQRDNSLIDALSVTQKVPRSSVTIQSIVGVRKEVKLTSLVVDTPTSDSLSIIIQGIAPNRDTLLAFKIRLEDLVPGGSVELPVADLAKSKDLQFSMRITQTFK
jgi:hypothetical protein